MAEALKNMYNKEFLNQFAQKVRLVYKPFDIEGFIGSTIDDTWDELKLMDRMRKITNSTCGIFATRL